MIKTYARQTITKKETKRKAGPSSRWSEEAAKSSAQKVTIKLHKIVKSNHFSTLETDQKFSTNEKAHIHKTLRHFQ